MKRLLLISIITLFSFNLQAQSFTDKCLGIWNGKMEIFNQSRKIADVDVRMTISKIDSTSWSWKTEYLSDKLPVTKNYILKLFDDQKGEYLIDEGNGIILKEQLFGNKMMSIFELFRSLRFADENVYLRAGSLNVINGMVGLNFSCDGSHYMRFDEFLEKSTDFWFGTQAN